MVNYSAFGKEALIVFVYFNAKVSSDHVSWPSISDHYGVGKMNKNVQSLRELCACMPWAGSYKQLILAKGPSKIKMSWCHSRSIHWHEMD